MSDRYGNGLRDLLDIQRRMNESDNLFYRQMLLSSSEDSFERIRQLTIAQFEHRKQVDKLITRAKELK